MCMLIYRYNTLLCKLMISTQPILDCNHQDSYWMSQVCVITSAVVVAFGHRTWKWVKPKGRGCFWPLYLPVLSTLANIVPICITGLAGFTQVTTPPLSYLTQPFWVTGDMCHLNQRGQGSQITPLHSALDKTLSSQITEQISRRGGHALLYGSAFAWMCITIPKFALA